MHSDPVKPERRPYEDALDAALDETGAISGNTSRSIGAFEVEGQDFSSTSEVPPDVRAAIDETSQALDDIFGGPPMKTHMVAKSGASAERVIAAAETAVAEPSPPEPVTSGGSLEETAPMPPAAQEEILAAAQLHSHPELTAPEPESAAASTDEPVPEPAAAVSPPSSSSWTAAADVARPAPSRVTLASDPAPVERPEWMKHATVILAIAVIGGFTLAGLAILLLS